MIVSMKWHFNQKSAEILGVTETVTHYVVWQTREEGRMNTTTESQSPPGKQRYRCIYLSNIHKDSISDISIYISTLNKICFNTLMQNYQ